jgi:hypothetical protein
MREFRVHYAIFVILAGMVFSLLYIIYTSPPAGVPFWVFIMWNWIPIVASIAIGVGIKEYWPSGYLVIRR